MKKSYLLLSLLSLFLISCIKDINDVILTKDYDSELPENICRYSYRKEGFLLNFTEKCDKYEVGDSIYKKDKKEEIIEIENNSIQ